MDMNRMLDIKDMLFQIVRKWKRIFVWMIVFAILFDGYGAVKSYNDAIHAQQTANQTIDPSSYRESLSADRADAVEKAFDLYKQYNEIYESSKEYCDHAIRMKLDYTAVPTVNFMYQVSNCDNITALYTYIDEEILSDDWLETAVEEMGWEDVPFSYVSELISFSQLDGQDSASQKAFKIKIISTDRESAELLGNLIQEQIEDQDAKIRSAFNGTILTMAEEQYRISVDADVLTGQQWHTEQMNNSYNTLNSLANNFDDGQRNYYAALIEQSEEDVQEEAAAADEIRINPIHPRSIAFGIFGGAFFACCYYALRYFFSKKLRSISDPEDSIGMTILEKVERKGKKVQHKEWMKMVCTKIKIDVKREGFTSLYLTSSVNLPEIDSLRDLLEEELKVLGCEVAAGGSVISDADSLASLCLADSVVFLEEFDRSFYDDIAKEMEICQKNNISVIGTVVFH